MVQLGLFWLYRVVFTRDDEPDAPAEVVELVTTEPRARRSAERRQAQGHQATAEPFVFPDLRGPQ